MTWQWFVCVVAVVSFSFKRFVYMREFVYVKLRAYLGVHVDEGGGGLGVGGNPSFCESFHRTLKVHGIIHGVSATCQLSTWE